MDEGYWMMLFSVALFTVFMIWDIVKALSRGAFWIPGRALVLSGLTIQLLAYLERTENEACPTDRHSLHLFMHSLLHSRWSMVRARITLSVFVGYLVPGMASADYGERWSNMVAVFLSLSTHIAKEYHALDYIRSITDSNNSHKIICKIYISDTHDWNAWSLELLNQRSYRFDPSELLSVLCLILLLGLAVSFGKSVRNSLSLRIPILLPHNFNVENETHSLQSFNEVEILKPWIVARVCQPEYVVARSTFSVAAGILVTYCLAIFALKNRYYIFNVLHKTPHSMHQTMRWLQLTFCLIGWIVVLYRWLMTVLYFASFTQSMANCNLLLRAFVRRYIELQDLFVMIVADWTRPLRLTKPLSRIHTNFSSLNILWKIIISLAAPVCLCFFVFSLGLLIILVSMIIMWMMIFVAIFVLSAFLIYLTLLFWCLSAVIFRNKFIWCVCRVDQKLWNSASTGTDDEFSKYKQDLERLAMPGEDAASLWIANHNTFRRIKLRMENAYKRGQECQELIGMIGSSSVSEHERGGFVNRLEVLSTVKEYFPAVKEPLWRTTALSLIEIITEVSCVDDIDRVEQAIKAYEQAQELMDFVDCPANVGVKVGIFGDCNVEAFAVRCAANKQTAAVNKSFKKLKEDQSVNKHTIVNVDETLESIRKLSTTAEQILKKRYLLGDISKEKAAYGIYSDWKSIAPSYCMYKVCMVILDQRYQRYANGKEVMDMLIKSFIDVIACCLSELPDLLIKNCRKWAAKFEEENIADSMAIAGKAMAVIDEVKKTRQNRTAPTTSVE